jgi:AcrR family transcriptional regulator
MLSNVGRPRAHDHQTAAALLSAAERRIRERGVDALSLREVARDAGTTTRAVYSVFGSKDGLVGALATRAFDLLRQHVQALPTTDHPEDDLVEAALVFRRFALQHPALFSVAFHRASPAISPRFQSAAREAMTVLQQRFEPLADAGRLGGRTVSDAALQFDALCEGIAWMELRGNRLQPDPERFWRNAFNALVTGFATSCHDRPRRRTRARHRTTATSRRK